MIQLIPRDDALDHVIEWRSCSKPPPAAVDTANKYTIKCTWRSITNYRSVCQAWNIIQSILSQSWCVWTRVHMKYWDSLAITKFVLKFLPANKIDGLQTRLITDFDLHYQITIDQYSSLRVWFITMSHQNTTGLYAGTSCYYQIRNCTANCLTWIGRLVLRRKTFVYGSFMA